jgi:hypothetical protein
MIHFLAHHLADKLFGSRLSVGLVLIAGALLWLRAWLGGTTNTWEREWRGKRVIVVVSAAQPLSGAERSSPLEDKVTDKRP